jgi:hypothetical protein
MIFVGDQNKQVIKLSALLFILMLRVFTKGYFLLSLIYFVSVGDRIIVLHFLFFPLCLFLLLRIVVFPTFSGYAINFTSEFAVLMQV